MAKKKTKKVYVLDNGERYDIIGENGRYYLCEVTQFRKAAERGRVAKEEIAEEEPPVEETPAEEAPAEPENGEG